MWLDAVHLRMPLTASIRKMLLAKYRSGGGCHAPYTLSAATGLQYTEQAVVTTTLYKNGGRHYLLCRSTPAAIHCTHYFPHPWYHPLVVSEKGRMAVSSWYKCFEFTTGYGVVYLQLKKSRSYRIHRLCLIFIFL